jgi:beta-lactamase class A
MVEGVRVQDSAIQHTLFPPPAGDALPGPATASALPAPAARVGPMPTPIQVPRSSRYSSTELVPDLDLGQRISQRLAGRSGKFGIAIKDLDTGRGVLIDPDGEYEAASLFKLPVMYELFKQRELGGVSFDESLVLTERHVAYDLGTLDREAGSTIELDVALERMITISDNSSAVLLTDRVGAFNVNQDMRSLGLEHTRILADDLATSPADMLAFLEMLARGQGVSPAASAEMIHLLARQRVNDRIPRLLPADTIVAHKTGNLPGVVNDVGIVYGPDLSFIVVVLVDRTADEGEATRVASDLALTAYEHFRGSRPQGPGLAPNTTRFPVAEPTPTRRPRPPTAVPTPTLPPTATETAEAVSTAIPTVVPVGGAASPTGESRLPGTGATTPDPTASPTAGSVRNPFSTIAIPLPPPNVPRFPPTLTPRVNPQRSIPGP